MKGNLSHLIANVQAAGRNQKSKNQNELHHNCGHDSMNNWMRVDLMRLLFLHTLCKHQSLSVPEREFCCLEAKTVKILEGFLVGYCTVRRYSPWLRCSSAKQCWVNLMKALCEPSRSPCWGFVVDIKDKTKRQPKTLVALKLYTSFVNKDHLTYLTGHFVTWMARRLKFSSLTLLSIYVCRFTQFRIGSGSEIKLVKALFSPSRSRLFGFFRDYQSATC